MDRERLKRDVERIEKHRKEKAEVAKSEREIFAALKGDGFNCKVVREILKRRAMDDSAGWDAEVATYEAAVQSLELAAERVREGATYEQAATEHNVRKADLHHFVQATAVPETQIPEHDTETGEITETADRKPPGDSSERDGEGSSSGAAVASNAAPQEAALPKAVARPPQPAPEGGVGTGTITPGRALDAAESERPAPAPESCGAASGQQSGAEEAKSRLTPSQNTQPDVATGPQDPIDLTPPPFLRRKVAA